MVVASGVHPQVREIPWDVAGVSGGYFAKRRQAEPSPLARDRAAAERLWALSARLCGLDGA